MMIEDEELRSIFKAASEEHLQNLDNGLLHLEKHPNDLATIEALMREAHSLKGDANMLGIKNIGTLAHQVEHILTQLKQQQEVLSSELGDRLADALAAMHCLVQEAVTGEASGVDTFRVLARLMGAQAITPPSQPSPDEASIFLVDEPSDLAAIAAKSQPAKSKIINDNEPQLAASTPHFSSETSDARALDSVTISGSAEPAVTDSIAPVTSSAGDKYHIETIRVATRNLDALMTQAGELTVTKIRIAHRLAEIEAIANLWEEWSRDLFANRFVFAEARKGNGTLHRLESFHDRSEGRLEQLGDLIQGLHNAFHEDTTRLETISNDLEDGIRTLRMLPLSTIFAVFPRMVRDLARQEGKSVELVIEGADTRADKRILEEMKDPLMHILRNAIDHGIESPAERERLGKPATATICLRAYQTPTSIVLEVTDDGRGLDINKIKQTALKRGVCREEELALMSPHQIQSLIFSPGFSTRSLVTEISGRGVGLDVVQTNVEKLKGTIQVDSISGQGCTMRIQLGLTLATTHVLIVTVQDISYAIPVEFVRIAFLVKPDEVFTLEGRDTILRDGQPISVAHLADLLELPAIAPSKSAQTKAKQKLLSCIILQVGRELLGVFVDALLDEQDVVIKPQSQLLKRVRNVSGATILGTGEVCMILNPQDLIKSVRRRAISHVLAQPPQAEPATYVVLLVEDSIATRTQEKRILEAAGYEVITAVDGMDGFNKLRSRHVDAVVSDVQMPNLDGLELAAKIRQHQEYNEIPIILVTSLASDDDKRRGAEAGANAYIPKGSFNQDILIETLQRLI